MVQMRGEEVWCRPVSWEWLWDIFRCGTYQDRRRRLNVEEVRRRGSGGLGPERSDMCSRAHLIYLCHHLHAHAMHKEALLQVEKHILRVTRISRLVESLTAISAKLPFSSYPLSESCSQTGCCLIYIIYLSEPSSACGIPPSTREGLKMCRGHSHFRCCNDPGMLNIM